MKNENQSRHEGVYTLELLIKVVGPILVLSLVLVLGAEVVGQIQDTMTIVSRFETKPGGRGSRPVPFVSIEDHGFDIRLSGNHPFWYKNTLLFSQIAPDGTSQIASIDLSTFKITESRPNFDVFQAYPTVSPDGKFLAYISEEGISIMPTDSVNKDRNQSTLLNTGSFQFDFSRVSNEYSNRRPYDWSPDSSKLIVSNEHQLIELHLDGSAPTEIPLPSNTYDDAASYWVSPTYSPSGEEIVTLHHVFFNDSQLMTQEVEEIVFLSKDGTVLQKIDLVSAFNALSTSDIDRWTTTQFCWINQNTIAFGFNNRTDTHSTKSMLETESYLAIDLATGLTKIISLEEFASLS